MKNQGPLPLRERAMEVLRESSKMFTVASNLLEQGNREEAKRLQFEARAKRDASVLLMAKANALENASGGETRYPNHDSRSSRSH
jgi:hypothetical protein